MQNATDAQQPVLKRADPIVDREALLEINIEYIAWVTSKVEEAFGLSVEELVGVSVATYATKTLNKTCGELPPRGIFYLALKGDQITGMGGLRQVRDGVAEIKRIYVRPFWRGRHFGEAILQRLVDDARAFGYRRILLDTGPFMSAAQRLYERAGFASIGSYPEAEVPPPLYPVWRFMAKEI